MLYELAWSCDYDPVCVKPDLRAFQEAMYNRRSQITYWYCNLFLIFKYMYYMNIISLYICFCLSWTFVFNIIIFISYIKNACSIYPLVSVCLELSFSPLLSPPWAVWVPLSVPWWLVPQPSLQPPPALATVVPLSHQLWSSATYPLPLNKKKIATEWKSLSSTI